MTVVGRNSTNNHNKGGAWPPTTGGKVKGTIVSVGVARCIKRPKEMRYELGEMYPFETLKGEIGSYHRVYQDTTKDRYDVLGPEMYRKHFGIVTQTDKPKDRKMGLVYK